MHLDDFDYELPDHLIARYPLAQRSASRLLCVDRVTGALAHRRFIDLPDLLQPGDLLVFNNTRVLPARLFARKETGGQVEILLERVLSDHSCLAQVRASKSPREGARLQLDERTGLTVTGRDGTFYRLETQAGQSLATVLEAFGHMPLPPYIDRSDEAADQERYQTVYAREPGAVAAPTAGLHFDRALLDQLRGLGIETAEVTLHVGAGTFQPVRVEDIRQHVMHSEVARVDESVCQAIAATRARGGRVIAVGTTSVRALETAALDGGLKPFFGETRIFIYPGFVFQAIDGLITNFHLPRSTLLMLVSALAGRESILAAYREAVRAEYRFFSYGDAMFLMPPTGVGQAGTPVQGVSS